MVIMLTITSSAFKDSGDIPPAYTCDGKNISPPLAWDGVPAGTKSFVLINDDPDAPAGTWIHWVAWNISSGKTALAENISPDSSFPDGMKQGINDFGATGYGGPAPPSGKHRYFFKLYALDTTLLVPGHSTAGDLEKAMKGHILGRAQIIGLYSRKK